MSARNAATATNKEKRGGYRPKGRSKQAGVSPRYVVLAINIAIILLAVSVIGVFVYPNVQNWWKVRRDIQLLQTERDAVNARNEQIQSQIDALGTAEGIASRAREEFNWVFPGENAINISGLDFHDSSTALPENIAPGSLRPQIDWVTETLDFIFGYEYPQPPPAPDDIIIGL